LMVLVLLSALAVLVINLVEVVQVERQLAVDEINKSRSRLLARSGVEYIMAKTSRMDLTKKNTDIDGIELTIGHGTYLRDGDRAEVSAGDSGGKININDGIDAGRLEQTKDNSRNPNLHFDFTWQYNSKALNPWPKALTDAPQTTGGVVYQTVTDDNLIHVDKSALANLRLRRLLNAYGDVHLFIDKNSGWPTPATYGSLPTNFEFKSTAVKNKGISIPGEDGLGDWIISNRPSHGYTGLKEIHALVNSWSSQVGLGTDSYQDPSRGKYFETFYDSVTKDFTLASYQDTSFKRLRTETAITLDVTVASNPYNAADSAYYWSYQNDHTNPLFHPNFLDQHAIDLTDDLLWSPHSVALINLNAASDFVKAAVFYAPVNVSYLCEGAVTHTQQQFGHGSASVVNTDLANEDYYKELGMGRSSIGVRGPCFKFENMKENGHYLGLVLNEKEIQTNRFMSLRDALNLAKYYEDNFSTGTGFSIRNFDDFKSFLIDYRRTMESLGDISYERAIKIELDASGNIATGTGNDFFDRYKRYFANDYDHALAGTSPGDASFDPYREDDVWVSQYWYDTGKKQWLGGWFLDDYVERTLPHIFSCVRRISGYLGAPLALTSPYMILEPFAYVPDPKSGRSRDDLRLTHFDNFATEAGAASTTNNTLTLPYITELLGRQPKISVEDLVERHNIPKVCFLHNGVVDINSVGKVYAPSGQIVSQTTIYTSVKIFDTVFYRTQYDFARLKDRNPDMTTNSSTVTQITMSDGQEADAFVIGPEFKTVSVDIAGVWNAIEPVTSKYWLTCGLADANSQAGAFSDPSDNIGRVGRSPHSNDDSVKFWDLYLEGNPRDGKGGLWQHPGNAHLPADKQVSTILPPYGSTGIYSPVDVNPNTNETVAINLYEKETYNNWEDLFNPAYFGIVLPMEKGNGSTNYFVSTRYNSGFTVVKARKRGPDSSRFMSTNPETGRPYSLMEEATTTLWAQKDGHDLDPFGGGIFFGSGGNGEYAEQTVKYPIMDDPLNSYRPVQPDPKNPVLPLTFRDSMFWNLNNKHKSWSLLSRVFDATKPSQSAVNPKAVNTNGIIADAQWNYIFAPELNDTDGDGVNNTSALPGNRGRLDPHYNAGREAAAINPDALGFHRGFFSAWFRIPTSYPFAQPVYYGATSATAAYSYNEEYGHYLKNKTHLFKTIMATSFGHLPNWVRNLPVSHNKKIIYGAYTHPSGFRNINIHVGWV